MCGSLTLETRRAHEMPILRTYHDAPLAGGVWDSGFDAFFDDYRRSLLVYVAIS